MQLNFKKYAVIVAGGSGSRMNTETPKQFIRLKDKVILMHTIDKFKQADSNTEIILVLPENHIETWNKLVKEYLFNVPHKIYKGGASRFQSVKNGLEGVSDKSLVAVHDGVRPFVLEETINLSYEVAAKKGNAIVSVPLKDSIRKVTPDFNKAENRSEFRLIQTPQTFQSDLIKKAYFVKEQDFFTDDASVLEFAGHKINLIDGSYQNIKITTPEDLIFANSILNSNP